MLDATQTQVGRFMDAHGFATLNDLRRRSIDDPEWFWDAVSTYLEIPWSTPYKNVLDTSRGIQWATWFVGGRTNFADACLRGDPERVAVIWEGEDGVARQWTYRELEQQVDALAAHLAARGITAGDGVGIFMPMIPETVAALLAVVKIGAVFLPLFSGYGADAIATRLNDAEAKALITADGTYRRGKPLDMKAVADDAVSRIPTVHTVVTVPRLGRAGEWPAPPPEPHPTTQVDSEHPLFIAYTSGTTGRPKGTVAVHGGFLVKVAEEGAFQFDVGGTGDDRAFWFTDMGWIMGPWVITAALANRQTVVLYEGAPDYPSPERLWEFVARHQVTNLGISPTLIRSLMPHGREPVDRHDLTSLRVLGSTGEPWNLDPWTWYHEVVGESRCPVINISGGTEVGACFLSPHPIEPIKPMSLGGPALGMAVDVYGDDGKPTGPNVVGELVCTKPWPGMTRGLYKDPGRYIETYWSRWPDVWVHGDWASYDDDGNWYLHGRSDDTIKVAGKRLGPAEVESAAVSHPAVVEAAAVGIPDEVKGETLWVFAVLAPGADPTDGLRDEIAEVVAANLGKSFKPSAVKFATAIPKTRNAKVLRRAIRATVVGKDPGDLSSLEDGAAIDAVKEAR